MKCKHETNPFGTRKSKPFNHFMVDNRTKKHVEMLKDLKEKIDKEAKFSKEDGQVNAYYTKEILPPK